jgi:radical SAM superfamily enzyme YgiQ (UPF0313 family)
VALTALSRVHGTYTPGTPTQGSDTRTVTRQWLQDLDRFPTHSVLRTPHTEFSEMGLVEIARGCRRGCRFCLAGHTFRPPRQRSVDSILAQASKLLKDGQRLGLVSAAVSDYIGIDRLVAGLRTLDARISVSSLRVDSVTEPLVQALAQSGARTLTIAPEAGSERLRQAINKRQTENDILRGVDLARRFGLGHLKLYFMLGLPTEVEADVEALVSLALTCAGRFGRKVTVNITPFVPKAHTPFQRMAQAPTKVVARRLSYVERKLRRKGIAVKSESPAWAEIQGSLARGDHRLAEALLMTDRVTPASWRRNLRDAGLSLEELLHTRPANEILPWDFIDSGLQPRPPDGQDPAAEAQSESP